MPNLQSLLVNNGINFTDAFAVNGTCCPARAAILRGQYPHNSGITRIGDAFKRFRSLGKESDTLATNLQFSGYRTGLYGKYFVDYPPAVQPTYTPPGWDEWVALGNSLGYYNYDLVENGVTTRYGDAPEDYLTDVLATKVQASIALAQTDPRPFFLYVAPLAPHEPATPAPRHATLFAGVESPKAPSYDEADVTDKPLWIRDLRRLTRRSTNQIDDMYRDRLRALQALDEMLAGLVNSLQAIAALENTYIIFTSDQGFLLGEHRIKYGKGNSYEEAINVPFVMRGPGVATGVTSSSMVLHTDIMPTILDLTLGAGAIPAFVDGRSIQPLLGGSAPRIWRTRFAVEHLDSPLIDVAFPAPPHQTLRTKKYVYVEYQLTGEREFYDLRFDPFQNNNTYDTTSIDLILDLAADLATLSTCAGSTCVSAEDKQNP
jgi:arylsulfatase A-like enzyme